MCRAYQVAPHVALVRLFLGVPAPEPQNLRALAAELRRNHADMRPVPDGSWHVTLRFLGQVRDPDARERLMDAVSDAVSGRPALPCRLKGLGAFPQAGNARVAWVGVECDGLGRLAERIASATALYGDPPEPKPFRAHVTVGRMKIGGDLSRDVAEYHNTVFGQGAFDEVVLWASRLTPSGPHYDRVASWALE